CTSWWACRCSSALASSVAPSSGRGGAIASAATASSAAHPASAVAPSLREREARLRRQPEKDLTHAVGGPGAGAPLLGGHVIAAIEHLGEAHAAKLGNGEEGGGLHLDGEAPFGTAAGDLARRLAVDSVSRPRLAHNVVHTVRTQRRLNGGDGLGMRP